MRTVGRSLSCLSRLLSLVAGVGALAFVLRLAMMRLRRRLLLPTPHVTPPIEPYEVTARMRRIILSDLHLGAGDRLDDFDADAALTSFITSYALRDEPVELILAGDTFEFLQVRLPGFDDYEWSNRAAELRLRVILDAHPEPIAALRQFIARPGNQLTLLIGNHDFELHYTGAKQVLRETLGVSSDSDRLRFGISYEGGGIYIEHGNQFDSWNRFLHVEGISDPFEVVRGTRIVKDVINYLEDDLIEVAPLIDNVKPTSAVLWYLLSIPRLRRPDVRRYIARGLLRLFGAVALPHTYDRRPVLEMRADLLGPPGATLQRELALKALYEAAPDMRAAAAETFGGVEPEVALLPAHQPAYRHRRLAESSEAVLERIEHDAERQLQREVREFRGTVLQAMARIAAERSHDTLFVCGHTHQAQVVPLNERQTYINTGTWTTIVVDLATGKVHPQRYPFLDVQYEPGDAIPRGRLLVWQGPDTEPRPWEDVED